MVNYQKGKIYKLVGSGLTYYGSTVQSLCERKAQHKKLNCSSKILFEKGDVDIVLVEAFPCNNKEELHSRERWYIENNECINLMVPMRTQKEWREQNKEKLQEDKKKWYQNNKEKNREQNKENNKKWMKENKDKFNELRKNWREKNRDKINEKRRLNRLYKKIDTIFYE
jgi:hypothetical protein